jgi:outer membrane cobalamin receptor
VLNKAVEKRFVRVLEIAHEAVFAERCRSAVQNSFAALALVLERADVGRQQAMQVEDVAFLFREGGSLVENGIEQKVDS